MFGLRGRFAWCSRSIKLLVLCWKLGFKSAGELEVVI